MQLLYRAAEWHALAKLRMHTRATLDLLEKSTVHLGQLMRKFRDATFTKFNTVALPREARKSPSTGGKKKLLNLNTYKFHSLGDYVRTIELFGCTDSYSTQLVNGYLPYLKHSLSRMLGGTSTSCSQTLLRVDEPTQRNKANHKALSPRGSISSTGFRYFQCQAKPIRHTFGTPPPCLGVSKKSGTTCYIRPETPR